jgi:regulator of nucleoside diphosphate kinase
MNRMLLDNSIVITEIDFDRLRHLAESDSYRFSYGSLLTELKRGLQRGRVVPPTHVQRGVITMNSRVRLIDLKTGRNETYTLVYPADANINENRLSVLAPLGTAMLGARIGQVIEVKAPAGVRRLKIDQILYQPESAGDYHL